MYKIARMYRGTTAEHTAVGVYNTREEAENALELWARSVRAQKNSHGEYTCPVTGQKRYIYSYN